MPHPGLTTTTWATPRGYVRPERPASDALVIPPATDLELAFSEIDSSGFPVFEFLPARALGDGGGVYVTGIDAEGWPIVEPDGVPAGQEATVSLDGRFLDFSPLEA